ncbi:MAG: motility associated factor glycosyltransferase family protein [Tepidisphaeraceae bacterium]
MVASHTEIDAADPSARFILPENAAFVANLAALWATDSNLASALEALHAQESYPVERSRCGDPTIGLETSSGARIYLHSRHDPRDEGHRLIDPIPVVDRSAFFVHGFGLGYHVQCLYDRAGDDAIICVFEPDLILLRTALESIDYSAMIQSGRVIFFCTADKSQLLARLHPHQPLVATGFESVVHAPSVQMAPEFHAQFQGWIEEFIAYCRTTVTTLVLNGKRTAENVAANLAWYVATPNLARLKDARAGQPAIIVSAGPSLRKNRGLLRNAVGNAVFIAVQTTLQPLLESGIEPDFATSLDYHEISTRFFEKLPRTLRTALVAEPKAAASVLAMNPGPLWLVGNDFAEAMLSEMRLNKSRLPSGATVAHLAFYLAEHLGCDPIIFVGQDLGFSDGLCYAPGTSYDDVWRPELSRFCTLEMKQWEQIARDRHILRRVPDHLGRPMYTEERLFMYLQHFERDFARSSARIIDATEGGVLKRGAAVMTLASAIDQFCRTPLAKPPVTTSGLDWTRLGECRDCLRRRRVESARIEEIARQTLPLLQSVRDRITDQAHVNRTIARIDSLRSHMHEWGHCYGLVMQLSQPSELRKFRADRRIAASKARGEERQRMQVERDIDNVQSLIDAAVEFQRLCERTMSSVESLAARERREAA